MKKSFLSIAVIILFSTSLIIAQQPGISIGGNVYFPVGDWAEYAKTGWGGSVTYEHPLGRGVSGIIYSGYTSFSSSENEQHIYCWSWSMIPLLVGTKFYFTPKTDFYATVLLGANFVTAEASSDVLESVSESSTEFAGNANLGYEFKVGEKGAIDLSAGFVYINDLNYFGMRLAYIFKL